MSAAVAPSTKTAKNSIASMYFIINPPPDRSTITLFSCKQQVKLVLRCIIWSSILADVQKERTRTKSSASHPRIRNPHISCFANPESCEDATSNLGLLDPEFIFAAACCSVRREGLSRHSLNWLH